MFDFAIMEEIRERVISIGVILTKKITIFQMNRLCRKKICFLNSDYINLEYIC